MSNIATRNIFPSHRTHYVIVFAGTFSTNYDKLNDLMSCV